METYRKALGSSQTHKIPCCEATVLSTALTFMHNTEFNLLVTRSEPDHHGLRKQTRIYMFCIFYSSHSLPKFPREFSRVSTQISSDVTFERFPVPHSNSCEEWKRQEQVKKIDFTLYAHMQ